MSTKIRSSQQLYIDDNLVFNSKKGTGLAAGTVAGDAVEYSQMTAAIANAMIGLGNSLHIPAADLAASKAVNAAGRTDKMLMLIETLGLYRFDAESAAVSNDTTVIRPTDIASDATAGRWIKISNSMTDHDLLSNILGDGNYHLSATQRQKLIDAVNYVHPNHSGDVTSAGDGAQTIAAKAVTNAKMADVATQTIKGRNTAGNGSVEDITIAALKIMLGLNQSSRTFRVTPGGTVNGSNTIFTIPVLVQAGTEEVFKNGLLMNAGADNDYTIAYGASTVITFITAPSNSPFTDTILVSYSV